MSNAKNLTISSVAISKQELRFFIVIEQLKLLNACYLTSCITTTIDKI